ncbi:hypothetical protein G9A89_023371 [Geosiphon pyriformis]|nr:hypothetical protein G9A89_023371 [Geosiphon pyriformis]
MCGPIQISLNCMKPLILLEDNITNRPVVWRNRFIYALKKITFVNENKDDPTSQLKERIAILLVNEVRHMVPK